MWHKAIWKWHPMRLELTRVGLLVELANHYTFVWFLCFITYQPPGVVKYRSHSHWRTATIQFNPQFGRQKGIYALEKSERNSPTWLRTRSLRSRYLARLQQPLEDILWNHHHVPPARISLTLSHHFSLSFIASGRSSGLHPVSSYSCYMYVRAGSPAFAWPYAGVHRSTSLSSSLLLQQCLACLVRLTFVVGGRWPYSWCLVGCCCQDLFNIALNILV